MNDKAQTGLARGKGEDRRIVVTMYGLAGGIVCCVFAWYFGFAPYLLLASLGAAIGLIFAAAEINKTALSASVGASAVVLLMVLRGYTTTTNDVLDMCMQFVALVVTIEYILVAAGLFSQLRDRRG